MSKMLNHIHDTPLPSHHIIQTTSIPLTLPTPQGEYPLAVVEACGSDLQALRTVLYLGGGALDLCTATCENTLTELAALTMRCTNKELEPFFGSNAQNALMVAQSANAKVSLLS